MSYGAFDGLPYVGYHTYMRKTSVYLTQDERVLFLEPEGNIFEPQARDLELYLRQTLSPGAYAAVMRALGEEPIIDL